MFTCISCISCIHEDDGFSTTNFPSKSQYREEGLVCLIDARILRKAFTFLIHT